MLRKDLKKSLSESDFSVTSSSGVGNALRYFLSLSCVVDFSRIRWKRRNVVMKREFETVTMM